MVRVIPYRKVSELDVLLKEHLSENTRFVVPSRRDREWWRIRIGAREFGPDTEHRGELLNWEDLYNELSEFCEAPRLRQIDPPDHRLILSHIVETFLREEKELLDQWPGLARPGFIDILSDDIRELINEGISVEQTEIVTVNENPTSRVLPCLYRRYLDYLASNGLMDSAQIPGKACELLDAAGAAWGEQLVFVFAGFMSFTHAQLSLVRSVGELCRETVVFKPETELREFQDATEQFLSDKTWEDPVPPSSGKIVSSGVSDFSLEPENIARTFALWHANDRLPGVLPEIAFPGFEAIGIMVPLRRSAAFEAALRRYRIPCGFAFGRSVDRTLLGMNLFPIWTAWVQGLEAYETALLLAMPCLAGTDFSIDAAVLRGPGGVKGWEAYLQYRENSAADREEKKHARHALKAFKAMIKFCRALEKGSAPAGIFAAFYDFLTTPGLWLDALAAMSLSGPDFDESLREMASSIAEIDAKRLALRELQPDLGIAGDVILKGKEAVEFLRSWCEDTLVRPAPPIRGAVTLYTGPPPILASHSVWIMSDVTQKNWPGTQRTSPLLDASERERMRDASAWLPSMHDKRLQREALFRRLMQTGESLTVVSHSATDEEGRPAGRTSLINTFIEDMKLWELIELPVAGIESLTPTGGKAYFPEMEAALTEQRERGMPVVGNETSSLPSETQQLHLPVSDLYDLLDCPFRYWLRRKAKLRERNLTLYNSAEAGELTHTIWEKVWRRKMTEGLSLQTLTAEEWSRALSISDDYKTFGHMFSDDRLKRHVVDLEFYLLRLAAFQQDILDRLSMSNIDHRVLYMEQELSLTCEVDGVRFTGRCDRVDLLNDRYVAILDYKLGRSASYEKKLPLLTSRRYLPSDLLGEYEAFRFGLQLSAYALMYGAQFPEHQVVGVGFLGHKDGGLSGTFASPVAACYLPDKKPASPEDRIAEAETAFRCAASILKNGRFEPCYNADSCRYCNMKGVCRKGELRGEALQESDDGDGFEDGTTENSIGGTR